MELGHLCLRLAIQWVQLSSHLSKAQLFIYNVGINIPLHVLPNNMDETQKTERI